ncbi:adenosine monophosphate transferase FICD like [Fusarium subglutinans]|uniref:Adenosine monophosphate transferase FICD like n=1 Tax=Gibberella subglutinans TaxID=42677 RepID=A0A8H5QB87_GIBSU|nr:adenosine monophosphate transferase FICD like [Fusarium subglutinans]KAF5612087.1 adenosine monophosphate transferase FICD like [Fusarium subglutinans]
MAPKLERRTLAEAFEGLEIPSSSRAHQTDSNLGHSIHLMLSSSLRGNGSIRIHSGPGKESTLQLTQDDAHYEDDAEDEDDDNYENYDNYENDAEDQSHSDEDDIELKNYLDDIADALKKQKSKNDSEIAEDFNEKLSQMVYGSNMLEMVGSGLDTTVKLCQRIFEGRAVDDAEISDRDPIYQALRMDLVSKNKSSGHEDVLRSRREIIQHAKAAYYMMNEVAIKGKDLSEEIILETHRLLTYQIDSPDNIPSSQYGGIYRDYPVQRGFHSFPHQAKVPKAVRDLTDSLKADIATAEDSGEIDPVALAAKYCHKFVNIHPFLDGNSRTSRLILNTILLKYGGCFVWLGMEPKDRDEYMKISAEGFSAEAMEQEDMEDLPEGFKPKHHKKLATFTLKHARETMTKVLRTLKRKD